LTQRRSELTELRRRIAQLTDEARKNEETWKRSQRLEMAVLDAEDLPALLRTLTDGILRSYRLQASSMALADPDHEIRNLLSSQGTEPDDLERVLFVDEAAAVLKLRTRRPWLGEYTAADHERLFRGARGLASVALLPLVRHARVVGSLHFGSTDPGRFTSRHATDFLDHLAIVAAFGLENAVNRAKLVRSGFTDVLTGWHNRAYLQIRLEEELARCRRERTTLVCLMLDVDHFKRVNDDHGHAVGDAVLREVARRINGEVRSSDVSARYGGEEFIVLLPHTGLEVAERLAERIRAAVFAEPFGLDVLGEPLPVTVSIGLAEHRPDETAHPPAHAAAGEALIAAADAALYKAKASGRNAVALAGAPRRDSGVARDSGSARGGRPGRDAGTRKRGR
jgi:diguanylate cyclase (GGDEF)-like protein